MGPLRPPKLKSGQSALQRVLCSICSNHPPGTEESLDNSGWRFAFSLRLWLWLWLSVSFRGLVTLALALTLILRFYNLDQKEAPLAHWLHHPRSLHDCCYVRVQRLVPLQPVFELVQVSEVTPEALPSLLLRTARQGQRRPGPCSSPRSPLLLPQMRS